MTDFSVSEDDQLYDTESEGELPSGYSEDESSDDSSGTDEFTSPSSIESEISDASASESVPSNSTATDITESESSSDISELSDASTNRLSKLLEFHTPLYEGADLTILDSYLMLYQFALRHCITDTAFSELISLVDTHVPKDAKSATSLYKLRKFFESNFNDLGSQLYTYCIKCHRLLEGDPDLTVCPSGCGGSQVNKFLYVPIQPQLKKKLEGKCVCVCVCACVHACMLYLRDCSGLRVHYRERWRSSTRG